MVNYQSGKIYKITGGNLTYIGSTTVPLSQRLAQHKYDYKDYNEGKRKNGVTSFKVLDYPDCAISLIEKSPCKDKEELHARERFWIENTDCVNKFIPNRSKAEYFQDNKVRLLAKNKIYRVENVETINAQREQYREQNREALREKARIYREKNKEEISKKQGAKWTCECGRTCQNNGRFRHLKSEIHIIEMAKINLSS
jgi:hypothetical protein